LLLDSKVPAELKFSVVSSRGVVVVATASPTVAGGLGTDTETSFDADGADGAAPTVALTPMEDPFDVVGRAYTFQVFAAV
jgi:hypothetical protein